MVVVVAVVVVVGSGLAASVVVDGAVDRAWAVICRGRVMVTVLR